MSDLSDLIYEEIWSDIDESKCFPGKRVLLSHYTSVQVVRDILTSNRLWLANPLLMNDSEELRFGMLEGAKAFIESESVRKAAEKKAATKILFIRFQVLWGS